MQSFGSKVLLLVLAIGMVHCDDVQSDTAGHQLSLSWSATNNVLPDNRFENELTLHNTGEDALGDDWELYFSFMRGVDTDIASSEVDMEHINGDFYRITPAGDYQQLNPGDSITITYDGLGATILKTDAPDGAYLKFADDRIEPVDEVTVLPFDEDRQLHRSPNDEVPFASPENIFDRNEPLSPLPADDITKITPTPVHLQHNEGSFTLDENIQISYEQGLQRQARFLSAKLEELLPFSVPVTEQNNEDGQQPIHLSTNAVEVDEHLKQEGDEAYRLAVNSGGIEITGVDQAGVLYGIQSLRALLPAAPDQPEAVTIDAVTVEDAPQLAYRGLHLDVSRNFQSVESVKKLLDVMSFYKLNTFHFHLTDDEGWRLAFDAFPELTEIGARRGHTLEETEHLIPSFGSGPDPSVDASMGSGWYSSEQYIDLLEFADERNIEVIPEIDIPGHARAAKVAMKNRYQRLMEENREEEAERYRIHDPEDESEYQSVQRWDDNVINACQESTYRFLEVIFDELIALYDDAGVPLTRIHVGGDEVPAGSWQDSPVCEQLFEEHDRVNSADDLMDYFFDEVENILSERDITMAAWEEFSLVDDPDTGETIANPLFAGEAIPYVWSNMWGVGTESYSYQLANAGYEIVMSHASNFYFDLAYHKHPEESGLYWAGFVDTPDPFSFIPFDLYRSAVTDHMGHPIEEGYYQEYEQLTEEGRENILGLQAQLWAETFRSPERLEYMALPRIIPLAERAWNPHEEWMEIDNRDDREEARKQAWNSFANRLGHIELPRLDTKNEGYQYRLPPPGATVRNGELHANVAYPGLEIRYTTDGSEPTEDSAIYTDPVALEDPSVIKLRSFSTTGRGSRVVEITR